jgi:hypothetical protein
VALYIQQVTTCVLIKQDSLRGASPSFAKITKEQDALLAEQQRLQEKQATITAQLDDKANEWLLKDRLTATD